MGFLAGKKLLITGVLSNRSIAYGIAKACHAQGAELAFSYVGERFKDRITEFAAEFDSTLVYDCDVADDACFPICLRPGRSWMVSFTASASPRARRLPVIFWKGSRAKPSGWPMTSAPTAFLPWPRPLCPTLTSVQLC